MFDSPEILKRLTSAQRVRDFNYILNNAASASAKNELVQRGILEEAERIIRQESITAEAENVVRQADEEDIAARAERMLKEKQAALTVQSPPAEVITSAAEMSANPAPEVVALDPEQSLRQVLRAIDEGPREDDLTRY